MTSFGLSNPLAPSLTRAVGFGATVAIANRLNIPSMVSGPIYDTLGGTIGAFSGDLARITVYGALLLAYDWWIWPFLHQYV